VARDYPKGKRKTDLGMGICQWHVGQWHENGDAVRYMGQKNYRLGVCGKWHFDFGYHYNARNMDDNALLRAKTRD
jgi:hypothetical protein